MRTKTVLQWIRTRQRDLTRAVLALFMLAWLQAAAVPCAMADGMSSPVATTQHACQYCPPSPAPAAAADHHGSCAYPHAPQVDARAATGLFFALPVTAPIATLDGQPVARIVPVACFDPGAPPTPLSVSYCRFLE